ncbi:PREDICTED: protein ACCELERATED CELL DEATH 6-like [Ipomoea nil]|uniref:protein ACCELERATED CELL DEATH 6-like n=1 Tax=Ipomoea nil TaxID=35883 RepID=UPI0009011091|nr:PREDICTED: protein ACCELERATED CELL DEATH 6-like [Ipomoea nil]
MIEMCDEVKDTALHKAVRMGHLKVVELLVKEDPEFKYLANDAGETPIYIAAEMQFHDCLVEMLSTCTKPTYDGPLGRNALHASVLSGLGYTKISVKIPFLEYRGEFATECTQSLLKNNICLWEGTDKSGWTPLHYAIKIENDKAARMIIEREASAAYTPAGGSDKWTTTFHIAARHDNVEMMKEISNRCPDCWEMVNSKGQNVLHEAMLSKKVNVIQHIEKSCEQLDNLVHHKDEDGNTPLHLLAVYDCDIIRQFIKDHPMLNYFAFNKENQTLFDMASSSKAVGYKKLIEKGKRKLLKKRKFADRLIENPNEEDKRLNEAIEAKIKSGETSILVATLIVTMTFATGLAVPGGYHQEKGYPLLQQNAAFKAFVITNTLAFLSSICSIAVYVKMVTKASQPRKSYEAVDKLYDWQDKLLRLTYLGVIIAFLCGVYATLEPDRPLAITDLVLGVKEVGFTAVSCRRI